MKQKITRNNWFILIFSFLIELVLLNIILDSKFDISIYSQIYKLIKINTVCIGVNLIFIFYILDRATNRKNFSLEDDKKEKYLKNKKNLLNIYKLDVNLEITRKFIFVELIKFLLVLLSLGKICIYNKYKFAYLINIFIITTIMYYVLYIILPKRDNIAKKLKTLKRDIKRGKTNLKFILIDGNNIQSSFNLADIPEYKISKNNIYINLKNELPLFTNSKAKKLIIENTIAIIHEVETLDNENIYNLYKQQKINNINMYHIMAVKNYNKINISQKIKNISAIKICDLSSVLEFTENLFTISVEERVDKKEYRKAKRALIKLSNLDKNEKIEEENTKKNKINNEKQDEEIKEYMQNLNIIYQYKFNNRLNNKVEIIPKEKMLFELYRNALLNQSAYQSILIYFNYITVMGKLVEYYLYAKNNPKYDKNIIFIDIVGDNPPIWNNHILLNIYKNKNDLLYKNIRENKFRLSKEDKLLLNKYLSGLLNIEIKGDEITFNGLMDLFFKFRNKIEAHGIISDANVYAVWNLTYYFANTLSKMLKISELECEYENNSKNVKIGYNQEKKVDTGKYITVIDDVLCFVKKDKKSIGYINYYTGKIELDTSEEEENR